MSGTAVMAAALPAVLVSSVIGSLHCAAMCGPLIGLSGGASLRFAVLHSLGRLVTYVALGTAAGAVGRAVDLAGDLAVVQRTATIVAGIAILVWGGVALATALGWRRAKSTARGAAFASGLVQIRSQPPAARAWLIGVLTGLLPCGWLWAFVIAAAGTGGALAGGLVMATFWLGTVPAMLGVLTLGGRLLDRVRTRIPAITAITLILLGVGTLAMRWGEAGTKQVTQPSCHEVRS
jgi:sulfite exporter TauE/SafE